MSLLYFGLKFLRLKVLATSIDHVHPITLRDNHQWPGWYTFKCKINADVEELNKAAIGSKTQAEKDHFDSWVPDGEFLPKPLPYGMPETVFIYHHSFSATCSSVGFKQLREANVKIITNSIVVKKCTDHSKKDHDLLQPFFCDNYGLEMVYEERTNDPEHHDYYQSRLDSIRADCFKSCGYLWKKMIGQHVLLTVLEFFWRLVDYKKNLPY